MLSLGLLKKTLILLYLTVTTIHMKEFITKQTADNFGPYDITFFECQVCRGPKSITLTNATSSLTKTEDDYIAVVNLTFFDRATIEEAKIVYYTMVGSSKQVLWSYNLKKPCDHFTLRKVIERVFNSQNCVVEKGSYVAPTSFKETFQTFLGSSFFYGTYIIKTNVMSKKGNILCLTIKTTFDKKNKPKSWSI